MFGIPVKLLKILFFFIKSNDNFKNSLIFFLLKNYSEIESLKIEFIEKRVYLNCSNRKILYNLIYSGPKLTEMEALRKYRELQNCAFRFQQIENNLRQRVSSLLGTLETEEGIKVPKAHWSVKEKLTVKDTNERAVALVHGTSNVPGRLTDSQFSTSAMKELIIPGSINPGTVITVGNWIFTPISTRMLWLPKWQVECAKYHVSGVTTGLENLQHLQSKQEAYAQILQMNAKDENIRNLCSGLHDITLTGNVSDDVLLNEMRKFKEENDI